MDFILTVVLLIFTSGLAQVAPGPSDKPLVGISLPSSSESRWVKDSKFFEKEGKSSPLTIQVSDRDAEEQNRQINQMLAGGIRVLIVAPHDGRSILPLIKKAHNLGVFVIALDRMIDSPDVDLYVGYDYEQIGEIQGKWLVGQVPRGRYLILSGAPEDPAAAKFKKGAMKFIQPLVEQKAINVVTDQSVMNWLPSVALTITEETLSRTHGRIDAVLAPNDGTAGGVIVALDNLNLAGKIPVTGQDCEAAALRRIAQGTQGMSILKDSEPLDRAALAVAQHIIKGGTLDDFRYGELQADGVLDQPSTETRALFLPGQLITKENLNLALDSLGFSVQEKNDILHGK